MFIQLARTNKTKKYITFMSYIAKKAYAYIHIFLQLNLLQPK